MYKCPVDNCGGFVYLDEKQGKQECKDTNIILCPKQHESVFRIGSKWYLDKMGVWSYGKQRDKTIHYYSCNVGRVYFPKMYRYIQRLKRTLIWYLAYKHIADSEWAKYGRFTFNRKKKQGVYYKKGSDIKRAFERAKYDTNGFDLFKNNRY